MKGIDRWLAVVLLSSVVARVAAVWILQSHHVPNSTYEHGEIAASLLEGRGFSIKLLGGEGPTSQQAPVYPFMVAAVYAVGGIAQPESLLILQIVQAFIGGLMVLGVHRLASWIAPGRRSVAIWAAVVAAFHPTLVYATTHVQVACVAAALVVWTIVWAIRAGETGRVGALVWTGVLLGLCALTDPILGLIGLGAFGVFRLARPEGEMVRSSGMPTAMKPAAIVICAAIITVTPWVVRNALVHGSFVPIKSTFGYAFWQGNCSISEGTDKVVRRSVENVMTRSRDTADLASYNQVVWEARHTAGYIDDIAITPTLSKQLSRLTEPERSRFLFWMAVSDIRDDPLRYASLCVRRFQYFWLFDETNPRTHVLVYRVSHLAFTGLAILGLLVAGPVARRRSRPLLLTIVVISLFHALTIVASRFHIPIEPLMAVWAGIGVGRPVQGASRLMALDSVSARRGLEQIRVVGRLG